MAVGRLLALLKMPIHHRWKGCVFVCVCVCEWEAVPGCVNKKGMGPGCAQVCVRSQLWNTACRLPASCPQAHGAPSPGHARSLRTLPAEPWSPRFRGSQLWAACGERTLLA